MKPPVTLAAAAALATLAACGPAPEQSVANKYEQTEKAIRDTASSYEGRVANDLRAKEQALDNQALAELNSINAAAAAESNAAQGNAAANSQ